MQIKLKIFFIIMALLYGSYMKIIKSSTRIFNNHVEFKIAQSWQILDEENHNKKLDWEKIEKPIFEDEFYLPKRKIKYDIKSIGRQITLNSIPFPEISNYVPNAYVQDPEKFITTSFRGISKTRHCSKGNFSKNCIDGVLDIDLNLFNTDNYSFNSKINIQSLSSRLDQTKIGEGISLGFKAATKMTDYWSLAFGGENVIHFDETIDLGRNFYLIASRFYPLSKNLGNNSPIIFLNAGIGTDFYGYGSNGSLGTISCLGKPNLTGEGTNNCQVGPIGSIAFAFNDRLTLVNEWFGYGYGSGLSFRPFIDNNLSLSFYVTDYIKGFPSHAEKYCTNRVCETRFYGSLSFSF